MSNLKKFINSHFANVIKYSYIGNGFKNELVFHNHYRLKKMEKSTKTYCGELNCGITNFILGNILKQYIPIKMYLYEFGYGKYKEDHVFLKYKDIIIDPTYRQFFTDNRKSGLSSYNKYLYEDLEPFFVGSYDELENIFHKLKIKNKKEFDYTILDDDILNKWENTYDITLKLNDFDKIEKSNYIKSMIKL